MQAYDQNPQLPRAENWQPLLLYATGLHELQAAPGKIIRDELNRDLSENEKIAFQANAERIASLMRIRQQAKDAIATQPKRPAP